MQKVADANRSLIVFLVATLGGGLLIGFLTPPDAWYEALQKPSFNPPGWVFAPVWTCLYILIAIAGARAWNRDLDTPLRLWFAQLALNFIWSPIFFVAHRPDIALGVVAALTVVNIAFIVATWKEDRVSSMLFVPYLAWTSFATLLNFAIVRLN
jgi:Tryptophan-rich sensory protein (mitochondrial benzodiazepine receptor homolog)